jgi:membrane protease YdiL (CAAX protease family)
MRKDLGIVICIFVLTAFALLAAGVPFSGSITVVVTLIAANWRLNQQSIRWADIGLRRPISFARAALIAVGWFIAAFLLAGIAQTVATSLLAWPPLDASRYGNLHGNLPRLLILLGVTWTTAAFGEELLFRAYLLTRLEFLLGNTRSASAIAVVLQAVLFGCVHGFQGATGILTTATVGLVFGVAYVRGRNLWPIMIAHGFVDSFGLVALYLGLSQGA